MYFFGPLSITDFSNITVRIITKTTAKELRNISILSDPKAYHSIRVSPMTVLEYFKKVNLIIW
jgi:hypothetical protein